MVIRVEQCAKFEVISSIMHGTPQFHPFHQFKIGQEWRVERQTILRLAGSLDHYSAPQYSDVMMSAMASQIIGALIVYSYVCSDADQRKHQSSASLVCVREIHRWIPRSHRWIPRTKASDAEHVCIWWRHHEHKKYRCRRWVLLHEMWSECFPIEMCLMNKINSHPKEFGREPSSRDPPLLILGECPHRGDSSPPPPPKKLQRVHLINAL